MCGDLADYRSDVGVSDVGSGALPEKENYQTNDIAQNHREGGGKYRVEPVSKDEIYQAENNQDYPIAGEEEKEIMPKSTLSG